MPRDDGWSGYLSRFHGERAGITEEVLGRSTDGASTPYDWLLAAVPGDRLVLDLACGSAPLFPGLAGRGYLGVDASPSELRAARDRRVTALVRASATELPMVDACLHTVVCSMGLQVIEPLPTALHEVARVLAPRGRLVATLPANRPLRLRDLPLLGGLLVALGRGIDYPNDAELRRLPDLLGHAGLRLESDERRRFGYRLADAAAADRFLASLYLPGVAAERYAAARRWLRGWAGPSTVVPVPIRRIVAVRDR